ncbi:MAG: M23 family metallopeptidase [Prolixibacteraceae bacterium]|nr:M23 family metallopeptidase [Prolixibacteraceae bacterium]
MKKIIAEIMLIVATIAIIVAFMLLNSHLLPGWNKVQKVQPEPDSQYAWGICIDSLLIDSLKVKPNQNLSEMLSGRGISAYTIDRLVRNSDSIFDVRKIQSGKNYFILSSDSGLIPDYLIYEESLRDYYVFHLSDSIYTSKGHKDVDTIECRLSGIIETSLWNSFSDKEVNPVLAIDLSDIYAWTIDFFGIQKGDRYKVIYDELYVEDKFAGFGKIHAAVFENMGESVYAYYFLSHDQSGYFDKEGNSLRKAFLKAPLNYSRISSRYSHSRMHPILKYRRPHLGVDYAAPKGTPVYSIGDGVVVKKAYQKGGGGNYLTIKHNSVYSSQYMHLNGYAKGISAGTRVKQGQLIGYVGKTGLASGPHLDFRIFKNGSLVDPLKVKAPPVEPISEKNMAGFTQVRDSLNIILESIPFEELILAEE